MLEVGKSIRHTLNSSSAEINKRDTVNYCNLLLSSDNFDLCGAPRFLNEPFALNIAAQKLHTFLFQRSIIIIQILYRCIRSSVFKTLVINKICYG